MGGCQKLYSPFGPPKNQVPYYIKKLKKTIILTTTHIASSLVEERFKTFDRSVEAAVGAFWTAATSLS